MSFDFGDYFLDITTEDIRRANEAEEAEERRKQFKIVEDAE